jgi:hypothetical protein
MGTRVSPIVDVDNSHLHSKKLSDLRDDVVGERVIGVKKEDSGRDFWHCDSRCHLKKSRKDEFLCVLFLCLFRLRAPEIRAP